MPEAEAPENLLDQLALTGALPRSAVASARQTARPGATPLGPVHSLIARGELEPAQVAAILITSCAPVLCNACGTQTTTDAPRCTSCDAEFDGPPILTSADVMLAERAGELRLGRAVAGQPGLARYQARAELGRGGMGVVLRALDTRLNREVALKVIRADRGNLASRVQRFLQEGRMLAALDHKGIVRVFEAGRHQRRVFMAMELVKGESLRDLARSGRLKLGAAVDAIVAAADALEAVHRHGIVHRDVKPANIVIEAETGRARLIDFGLARDEASSGNLTMAGVVVGTPHYFAPEQVQLREADGRTDIWALGVCLYELLFGRRPFLGRSKIEIVGKILKHTPAARRRDGHPLPEPLVEVALHALAKDPGDRPQTAATFADELRQARAAWQAGQSGDLIRASTASGRWSGSGSESASGTAPRQGRPREGGHAPRRLASADATASVRSLRARSRPAVKRRGPHP
ncbi:MAG: serine/threonine-protein kinase, partial [Planctomycetota bacterium]